MKEYWIDENCNLKAATIEFQWFVTPHTGEVASDFIKCFITMWELGYYFPEITTDNTSDIRSGISLLCSDLHRLYPGIYNTVEDFHVRCIAHVVNLGVKECMKVAHE